MLELLRLVVFAVFLLSVFVALGSWALRTRRVNPFSSAGRTVRQLTDPILLPLERWSLRRGGNPQNAGWWLLGMSVVGGIVVVTLAEWLAVQGLRLTAAATRGPRGVLRLLVYYGGQLILIALIVRVVASWFGAGRYNRWVRWTYTLTDWIVEPLRRIIPPLGMIDVTPIVAWLLIQFLILPLLLGIL